MAERSIPTIQSRKGLLCHNIRCYYHWVPAQLHPGNQPGQGFALFSRSQWFGPTTTDCRITVHLQQPQNRRQECERMAVQHSWMSRRDLQLTSKPNRLLRMEELKRNAYHELNESLKEGRGNIFAESGELGKSQYSFGTRFRSGIGASLEESVATAGSRQ